MKKNLSFKPWLIAIDFDGTFLYDSLDYPNYAYNPNDVKILQKLTEKGHKIAFLTGRSWNNTKYFYECLKLDFVLSNYNGNLIINPNDETFATKKHSLSISDFIKIIQSISLKPYNIIFEYQDVVKLTNFQDFIIEEYQNTDYKEILALDIAHETKNPLAIYLRFENNFDKHQLLMNLEAKFGSKYKFWFWRSERNGIRNLEINNKDINKLSAVQHIAAHYSIEADNIIAFGDNLNDLELLTHIKHGVAMKNGVKKLLQVANYQTIYSNNNSGVVRFLEAFFARD